MKRLLSNRVSRTGFYLGIVGLLFVLLIGARRWQDRALYPLYRNVIVDPKTGQQDDELARWLLPITEVHGDSVVIVLGNQLGFADSIKGDVPWVLAPTLRMHPNAKTFTVSWSLNCCTDGGSSDGGQGLIYHRDSSEVFYHIQGTTMGKPYDETTLIASGVDDIRIHRAAALGASYERI